MAEKMVYFDFRKQTGFLPLYFCMMTRFACIQFQALWYEMSQKVTVFQSVLQAKITTNKEVDVNMEF